MKVREEEDIVVVIQFRQNKIPAPVGRSDCAALSLSTKFIFSPTGGSWKTVSATRKTINLLNTSWYAQPL